MTRAREGVRLDLLAPSILTPRPALSAKACPLGIRAVARIPERSASCHSG